MTMHRGNDIGSRLMHRRMNSKARRINGMHISLRLHNTIFIDQTQVLRLHVGETPRKGIDPEQMWFDGIADGNVATGAFVVVPVHSEPAEAGCLNSRETIELEA